MRAPLPAVDTPLDPRSAFAEAAGRAILLDDAALLVDRELVALVRGRGAIRRTLAAVADQVAERQTWDRLGFVRQSDYARERIGGAARTLRDLATTGRRLRELPALARALEGATLSWSHVRAIARVATAEDEDGWIERARGLSVDALERAVRAATDASAGKEGSAPSHEEEEEPTTRLRLACRPETSAKWARVRELAQAAAGTPLPGWRSLEIVCAEVASALPPDDVELTARAAEPANPIDRAREAQAIWSAPDHEAAPGGPLADTLAELGCGLEAASPAELDRRLRLAIALEQRLDASIGAWLRILASRRLYRLFTLPSVDAYVRERLGMSPSRARSLLQIERCWHRPVVEAFASGRLSWPRAVLVASILRREAREGPCERWLAWAERVTVRRLQADVEVARGLLDRRDARWEDPESLPGRPFPRLDAPGLDARGGDDLQTCAADESVEVSVTAPLDVAAFIEAIVERVRRLGARRQGVRHPGSGRQGPDSGRMTPGRAFDWMLEHVLEAWTLRERGLRREQRVLERDGWRCQFPGCGSRANLHAHHIVFRSRGGGDEESNLITLCEAHHQRGIHAGRVSCEGTAPNDLRFETPIAIHRSGDLIVRDRTAPGGALRVEETRAA